MSSINPIVNNYRQIVKVLSTTRRLSRKTVSLKFVKKQYQAPASQEVIKMSELYSDYIKDLKEYSDLLILYKLEKDETPIHELLKGTATTTKLDYVGQKLAL
ncbi:hypothetical protein AKO1_005461 [Acrasis kona]|uniref:Uncharacterized protein n=1 Tax=Acrasis kona TaxID=1008807 RepID=A0AAW2ZJE2_9EUKA